MNENRLRVNKELPRYEHISRVELVDQEFEKTPKKNIKRYLYTLLIITQKEYIIKRKAGWENRPLNCYKKNGWEETL